jgi:hypothetical protein
MQTRHWEKVFQKISQLYYADMPFSLKHLMVNKIFDFRDEISEISDAATGMESSKCISHVQRFHFLK